MPTITSSPASRRDFERTDAWGIESMLDLQECDPQIIRDADAIRRFVEELCERIEMKRFGECQVVNFGEDERVAGFSMTQLIETSLISGHFANASNAVYLNIFSCKYYEPAEVQEFAARFFKARAASMAVALRKA